MTVGAATAERAPRRQRLRLLDLASVGYVVLIYVFFYLPIGVIFLFAFDTKEIPGLPLGRLTTDWFRVALSDDQLTEALWSSTWIAAVSASLATTMALPASMVLAWLPIYGKGPIFCLILSPIIIPQMVIGIAMLLLFRYIPELLGMTGIAIAHTTLTLCFATMILYSRFLGFQRSLIEAAMDLGATELRTFVEVILPVTAPALIASFLMTFTMSFGEFIVAWFVAGFSRTLPIEIWTSLRYVLSPKINAIASVIMIVSITLTALGQLWIIRQTRALERRQPR